MAVYRPILYKLDPDLGYIYPYTFGGAIVDFLEAPSHRRSNFNIICFCTPSGNRPHGGDGGGGGGANRG